MLDEKYLIVAKQLKEIEDLEGEPEVICKNDKELKIYIKKAAEQLWPEDEISDEAKAVIEEIGVDLKVVFLKVKEDREKEEAEKKTEEKQEIVSVEEKPVEKKKEVKKVVEKKEKVRKEKSNGTIKNLVHFLSPMIEQGSFSQKELIEKATEKGFNKATVNTQLYRARAGGDSNSFDRKILKSDKGLLSFE